MTWAFLNFYLSQYLFPYRLNLITYTWEKLRPKNQEAIHLPLACEKSLMTANQHFVYTFGGYGDPPEPLKNYPIQPQFNPDHNSHHQWPRGWNGNTNRFNLKTYQWEYLKPGRGIVYQKI